MSKRSRERKRLIKLQGQGNQQMGTTIITGTFEQRAEAIIREDNQKAVTDSRLPMHYQGMGNGHYIGYLPKTDPIGYKQPAIGDSGYKTIEEADKSVFRVVSTDITEGNCPVAKIPKVYVATRVWNEWISLADDYNTEWLAYLTGQFVIDDKGPRYEIKKMYFPPQVAHASHVDVDDDFSAYLPNTIGAIHSHVQMGVFFSGEDLRHSNWPVEIVVNGKGEYKCMIRHQLECGKWIKNYSEILTVGDQSDSRYVAALDKAFESGEQLRQVRVRKQSDNVGYRTPEVNQQPADNVSVQGKLPLTTAKFRADNDEEWHFKINGKPHEWRNNAGGVGGAYVEVVKVGDKWIFIDDPRLEKLTEPDATGNSNDVSNEIMEGSIEIDETTGRIVISSQNSDDGSQIQATQEELDRLMENEVDSNSCVECGGTGKVDTQVGPVECALCGGMGIKPGYNGYEGYTC